MAYATQSDIEGTHEADILLLLAPLESDPNQVDTDKVAAALDQATAEIDTFLRDRYVLPLGAPIDPDIVRICVDLTVYRLSSGLRETDQVRQRQEAAIKDLRSYARGEKKLDAPAPSSGGTGSVHFSGRDRVFDQDTLCDY